jgi:hypothetical protein
MEYPVVSAKLYKPPPEPAASRIVLPPVAVVIPDVDVTTEENPRPPMVACGA